MISKKNILIAPLPWGLGHATRCVPIIKKLINNGHHIILASSGNALSFLQKEFPFLKTYDTYASEIKYAKNKRHIQVQLLKGSFKMLQNIKKEKKLTQKICRQEEIDFIISDNHLGIRHKNVQSVIISHQLNINHNIAGWIANKVYRYFLNKYDQIWVPDSRGKLKISGKLSNWKKAENKTHFIGVCSDMKQEETLEKYQFCISLSGPEPQREILEKKLIEIFKNIGFKSIMIGGKIEAKQTHTQHNQLSYFNYMQLDELSEVMNASKYIVCRSGYSSLMDLAIIKKKGILIPTPQQPEQIYLAQHLKSKKIFDFVYQDDIKISDFLNMDDTYIGFQNLDTENIKLRLPDI